MNTFEECIEVVACSNNTIRAALTPKYRDIQVSTASSPYLSPLQNFCAFIDVRTVPGEAYLVQSSSHDSCIRRWEMEECEDFALEHICSGVGCF